MSQTICSICSYLYDEAKGHPESGIAPGTKWEDIPDDWKCPICGAGKDAFRPAQPTAAEAKLEKPHVDKELSPMEMSIICSNLARGCEKQYLAEQAEAFKTLAEFFKSQSAPAQETGAAAILELLEKDLNVGYPYGNAMAGKQPDRGALRCQVWSEKVTRMLQSLLNRYETEGDKMLENTGVYICTICGFVYVGDAAPELCPVCKVPAWKFEKVEGRAN